MNLASNYTNLYCIFQRYQSKDGEQSIGLDPGYSRSSTDWFSLFVITFRFISHLRPSHLSSAKQYVTAHLWPTSYGNVTPSRSQGQHTLWTITIYSKTWAPLAAFERCVARRTVHFETSVSHYVEYCAWQGGRKNPANVKSAFQCLLRIPYIVSPAILLSLLRLSTQSARFALLGF